jgi:hypothetical protein
MSTSLVCHGYSSDKQLGMELTQVFRLVSGALLQHAANLSACSPCGWTLRN